MEKDGFLENILYHNQQNRKLAKAMQVSIVILAGSEKIISRKKLVRLAVHFAEGHVSKVVEERISAPESGDFKPSPPYAAPASWLLTKHKCDKTAHLKWKV